MTAVLAHGAVRERTKSWTHILPPRGGRNRCSHPVGWAVEHLSAGLRKNIGGVNQLIAEKTQFPISGKLLMNFVHPKHYHSKMQPSVLRPEWFTRMLSLRKLKSSGSCSLSLSLSWSGVRIRPINWALKVRRSRDSSLNQDPWAESTRGDLTWLLQTLHTRSAVVLSALISLYTNIQLLKMLKQWDWPAPITCTWGLNAPKPGKWYKLAWLYFTVQAASFDIFFLVFLLLAAAVHITAAVRQNIQTVNLPAEWHFSLVGSPAVLPQLSSERTVVIAKPLDERGASCSNYCLLVHTVPGETTVTHSDVWWANNDFSN